jgi:hypothetical protein
MDVGGGDCGDDKDNGFGGVPAGQANKERDVGSEWWAQRGGYNDEGRSSCGDTGREECVVGRGTLFRAMTPMIERGVSHKDRDTDDVGADGGAGKTFPRRWWLKDGSMVHITE